MKSALITGVTGQDGSYLAELLLSKDYKVYGLVRRTSTTNTERIDHILDKITLLPGDLLDQPSLIKALEISCPDEVYNLAAQSFVAVSWSQPILTSEITGVGALRLLESIRIVNSKIRFYQASSSEMFGKVKETPQKETTPFHPRSPYGVAKAFAHYMTMNYRESYNMFAVGGILFNHESERRGIEFVTRKITTSVTKIKKGVQDKLHLGNLDAKRDWGYAKDYVEAMWLMLQQSTPEDYIIATGETHTVEEFCKLAFEYVDLDYKEYIEIDSNFIRPAEVDLLMGDPSKAKKQLGWSPKVNFKQLVQLMVENDMCTSWL